MTIIVWIIIGICFIGAVVGWFITRLNRMMGLVFPPIHGEDE